MNGQIWDAFGTNFETVPLSSIVLNVAWPVLIAYALYRVVLAVLGRRQNRERRADALLGGFGGAIIIWGRVIYSVADGALAWPFAFTILGASLIVGPRLVMLAKLAVDHHRTRRGR